MDDDARDRGRANGLVGMRERAAALDGTVEAGARPDGGVRVRARIPVSGRRNTPVPGRQ